MYSWLWRHLPGGLPGRLLGSAVLLAAAVLLLFFVVFPAVEPRLPFGDVTVDEEGAARPGASAPAGPTSGEAPPADGTPSGTTADAVADPVPASPEP